MFADQSSAALSYLEVLCFPTEMNITMPSCTVAQTMDVKLQAGRKMKVELHAGGAEREGLSAYADQALPEKLMAIGSALQICVGDPSVIESLQGLHCELQGSTLATLQEWLRNLVKARPSLSGLNFMLSPAQSFSEVPWTSASSSDSHCKASTTWTSICNVVSSKQQAKLPIFKPTHKAHSEASVSH